jgi:hypothetical protein
MWKLGLRPRNSVSGNTWDFRCSVIVQTVYRREAQAKVDRFEEEKENLARTALLNTIRSDNRFPVKDD